VQQTTWPLQPLDRFILQKLEAAGLKPSPPADRRTLLRRAAFDLLGIPPAWEDIVAFENDPAPDAWERVVERLLASPLYGQRWGRHWLDLARFADTKGYVGDQETRYPYSYTYRDYVIDALNADLPYDRFIIEQLAADLLPAEENNRALAGLGFLTLGRRFSNNPHDIIDDRIDVVTRGLMGLTVHCARCHDHKYDPIPTEDYYSLYGVFASSHEPAELPLLAMPTETAEYRQYLDELAARQRKHDEFRNEKYAALLQELRTKVAEYLATAAGWSPENGPKEGEFLSLDPDDLRPRVVERWKWFLSRQSTDDPVFGPWARLFDVPAESFSQQAAALARELAQADSPPARGLNTRVKAALIADPPKSLVEAAVLYGRLLEQAESAWQKSQTVSPPPMRLADADLEQLRQVLYHEGSPAAPTVDEAERQFDRATKNRLNELRKEVDSFRVNSPQAPPRAMVLADNSRPQDAVVFLRGNPQRPGPPVPRRFLRLISPDDRRPFSQGSGRLQLALAIASRDNPLTARAIVNLVWMHHLGAGLSRTPGDFGSRGEPPSHPELLDYLASEFIDAGWSLKNLHRTILLSATWQQASDDRADGRRIDVENRLLWRMNRRRLELEPLRDALLAVSGRLDLGFGGRSIDLQKQPFTGRRSVYGYLDRQNVPTLFRVFDFANPDAATPRRPETVVPQQALFVMNSPFVIEQARALVAKAQVAAPEQSPAGGDAPDHGLATRVRAMFRLAWQREPAADELALALAFLPEQAAHDAGGSRPAGAGSSLTAWEKLAQVLLCGNEFVFVD
jgi:hypothetical protein